MQIQCRWRDGLSFEAHANGPHTVLMDAKAPFGEGHLMSPKELVVAGLCGCASMDIVSWLNKHKQKLDELKITATVTMRVGGYPMVFDKIRLNIVISGDVSPDVAREAVHLSQTQFCSVSAMLSQTAVISYTVELNGQSIGEGRADFSNS